jgi:ribose transport system substrate-binding protein
MKPTLILAILLVILIVVGCNQTPASVNQPEVAKAAVEKTTIRLAVVNFSLCCPYFVGMSQAIEEEGAVYPNVELLVTDAEGDAEKLTADVKDVLTKDVDGIILSGAWLDAAPAALEAIKNAGVPVVMVDKLLPGGDYTSWIGPDNYAIGVQNGKYIVDRLSGKGFVVALRGGPEDNAIGLDRTNGLLSIVEQSNINVEKAPDFGDWSSEGGYTVMKDMLVRHEKIDAVFCENDSMCLGAQKAIAEAGRSEEMFLVGVDGEKAALEGIMKEGSNYAATGLNNSDEIGRAAFHRMMAIVAGVETPKDTVLPSPIITIDNVARYYNPNSVF